LRGVLWIALAGVCALLTPSAPAAERTAAAATQEPQAETLKERLSDKASDEQRVNNCNVPPEKRGPKKRPDKCATPKPVEARK
jgi:hypothetical protein